MTENFYPRPPRGGRHKLPGAHPCGHGISIHALREEGDSSRRLGKPRALNFYPRPPRGGRPSAAKRTRALCYFYPRPPRGGRRWLPLFTTLVCGFLSTPSARRATGSSNHSCGLGEISIHALREEGDGLPFPPNCESANFYPRPPRGGRQQKQRQNLYFQTNYTTFCTNLEEP